MNGEHDPGDEDDGLDGRRPLLFADPEHTAKACTRKFNLVYDPRAIHADTDIEKAVLAAVRRSNVFVPGGAFTVAGASDSLARFRLTPGEIIYVETPDQRAQRMRRRTPWWRRLWTRIRSAFTRRPQ